MKIQVKVQNDYLEKMSHVSKPLLALAELIWNGFDADATEVKVNLVRNNLGALEEIFISDNGHGISYEDSIPAFENLGGSWKKEGGKSKNEGRILHGKGGKGRFRAFALGSEVEWDTSYLDNGKVFEYIISGNRRQIGTFDVGEKTISKINNTGTKVNIRGVDKNFRSLNAENAIQEIAMLFALYMRQYPHLVLIYDGQRIDPSSVELSSRSYSLSPIIISDGRSVSADLIVIEWKAPVDRVLFLCDKDGFSLEKTGPGVQAPGFNFTGYLKSEFIKELDVNNLLLFDDLQPDLKILLDTAKVQLKQHFRERAAQDVAGRVEEWKKEEIYPYKNEPSNILEKVERQVFDVCALNLSSYLPDFDDSNKKSKRMALFLLSKAIESSPEAVQQILQDVLDLPKDKQEELSKLLSKTSLSAIINACREVTDRLDFIKGLEAIIFDADLKDKVLERKHLHRILANHTWIFGEEFHLSNDDESLTTVLKKYLEELGRNEDRLSPVLREDGSEAIIDLMLGRLIPSPRPQEREHLVIELKRPNKQIDSEVTSQIESYALAVANDDRFKSTKTKWNFWVIASEMNEVSRKRANQHGRSSGILYEDSDQNIVVWAKTWGQIIEDARARLKFYQERLEYCASKDSGLAYLKETHQKYLPEEAGAL